MATGKCKMLNQTPELIPKERLGLRNPCQGIYPSSLISTVYTLEICDYMLPLQSLRALPRSMLPLID